MDIYDLAKTMNVDYMDVNTGNIFKIKAYNNALRIGMPTDGIMVYDALGTFLGFAEKGKNNVKGVD